MSVPGLLAVRPVGFVGMLAWLASAIRVERALGGRVLVRRPLPFVYRCPPSVN